MNSTRPWLVPFAVVAIGVLALVLPGCREDEEKPVFPSTKECMNDPVFRKKLSDKRQERTGYLVKRTELVGEMEKMIEAKKAEMPGASEAQLKAALEKSPEWQNLYKRVADLTTAMEESGRKTDSIIRERLAAKKKISK